MVSKSVIALCQNAQTVSSVLADDPSVAPGEAVRRLFGNRFNATRHPDARRATSSQNAEEEALLCGRWGAIAPGPLFLQALSDSLNCLDADPMSGVVSPALMASHGTMPLTVIAPLADIIRHCSNMIVRAEREVFFVTCSWAPSVAQRFIRNALIELSRRAGERGRRVVVKMMYDKASLANVVDPRQLLKPELYASPGMQLPSPKEIPNLDLEVLSLHQLFFGTLHAKFCIVDRKVAAIMSNNIEDNPNMEMMTHVEGPIVDSIYDSALITWNHSFSPHLPSYQSPAMEGGLPTEGKEPLYLERGQGRGQDEVAAIIFAQEELSEHTPENPHYDVDLAGEINRIQSCYSAKPHETLLQSINRQLNAAAKNPVPPSGPEIPNGEEMTPYLSTGTTHPVPMALVSRPLFGSFGSGNGNVPQNEAWLSLIRNAKRNVFIQTPDLNAEPLLGAIISALKRGVQVTYYVCFGYNDAGEMIPGQGGTNDQVAQSLIASLPTNGPELDLLQIFQYVAKDQDHPIHQSFKSRTCHIKLLIADNEVGIQGSGNQDTQSWFHSQEMNIMVESKEICEKWRDGIERNQNTRLFGRVAKDGIWRDAEGRPGEGYMGNPGPVEGLFKGAMGMLKKMKDAGNI